MYANLISSNFLWHTGMYVRGVLKALNDFKKKPGFLFAQGYHYLLNALGSSRFFWDEKCLHRVNRFRIESHMVGTLWFQ